MENKSKPLISVIMTVYNRQAYIKRAIESVLNQSYDNWEIIAVDDGSRDYSAYLLELYKAFSEKIKVVYQDHKSLPAAKNNGILNSNGSFITFLDSDDEFATDHLNLRIRYLKQNPQVDLLHGGVKVIGNEYVPDRQNSNKLVHLSECTIGATFFGKRKLFIELNGFKEISYSEDSEFLERAERSFNVMKVTFPTYIYHRETPDSITNKIVQESK